MNIKLKIILKRFHHYHTLLSINIKILITIAPTLYYQKSEKRKKLKYAESSSLKERVKNVVCQSWLWQLQNTGERMLVKNVMEPLLEFTFFPPKHYRRVKEIQLV